MRCIFFFPISIRNLGCLLPCDLSFLNIWKDLIHLPYWFLLAFASWTNYNWSFSRLRISCGLKKLWDRDPWPSSNTSPMTGDQYLVQKLTPKILMLVASIAIFALTQQETQWSPCAATSIVGHACTSGSMSRAPPSHRMSIHNAQFAKRRYLTQPSYPSTAAAKPQTKLS